METKPRKTRSRKTLSKSEGGGVSKKTASLKSLSKIIDEIEAAPEGALLTKQIKREILFSIANCADVPPLARIKAIEVDNKMAGDNAPEQHQVTQGAELLAFIRSTTDSLL